MNRIELVKSKSIEDITTIIVRHEIVLNEKIDRHQLEALRSDLICEIQFRDIGMYRALAGDFRSWIHEGLSLNALRIERRELNQLFTQLEHEGRRLIPIAQMYGVGGVKLPALVKGRNGIMLPNPLLGDDRGEAWSYTIKQLRGEVGKAQTDAKTRSDNGRGNAGRLKICVNQLRAYVEDLERKLDAARIPFVKRLSDILRKNGIESDKKNCRGKTR